MKIEWPDFFPKECPPKTASPTNGNVFRLLNSSSPKEKDFKSYFELGKAEKACKSCGLSVYTDFGDILKKVKRIPAFRKKKIASGLLTPDMGSMKHTPFQNDSHHTWWLSRGAQPWLIFQVVEIREK